MKTKKRIYAKKTDNIPGPSLSRVKARSASRMHKSQAKVEFIPTKANENRIKRSTQEGHIKTSNNIMRFESIS